MYSFVTEVVIISGLCSRVYMYTCSCIVAILQVEQPVFPCMPSWPCVFQFSTLFRVAMSNSTCLFASGSSSSPCGSIFHIINSFGIFLMLFLFIYFSSNVFGSFASGCWFILVHFPPACYYNFLLFFWNVQLCLYCLTQSCYLLSLPSFANIFWFIF